jgi:pimeloyl-ACP methyl ester carboxylesterase
MRIAWISLAWLSLAAVLPVCGEYATVNKMKLYYEIHGQGRPIVLLHGGFNTIQTSFAKQIPVFAQNHQVIAIEQMAHGHTADVPGRPLTYEGMCEDTAALLVQLGIRNADFVGWSDGGQIALRMAFTHPELVRRVVASGVGFGATPQMAKRMATADMTNWFPEGKAEYARVSPDGPAHWMVFAEKSRAMWSKPTWGFTEAELAKIAIPVMIVAGDRDASPIEESVRIYRAIPRAQLCILPGTTHSTFQTRPEWQNFGPPLVVGGVQRAHDVGMLRGDVGLFAGVGLDVIEFPILLGALVDHGIAGVAHTAAGVFPSGRLSLGPATDVSEDDAVRPGCVGIAQERHQAAAVDGKPVGNFGPGDFEEGGKDVHFRRQLIAIAGL